MTSSLFLVETVLILGWLLASVLGSWAYFVAQKT
jgi:hypothetical protein